MTATFGARATAGGSADLSLGKRLRCRKARTISQITTASQIDDTKRSKVPPGRLQLGFAASIRGGCFGFRNGHSHSSAHRNIASFRSGPIAVIIFVAVNKL
jgi:hypothetical protein